MLLCFFGHGGVERGVEKIATCGREATCIAAHALNVCGLCSGASGERSSICWTTSSVSRVGW